MVLAHYRFDHLDRFATTYLINRSTPVGEYFGITFRLSCYLSVARPRPNQPGYWSVAYSGFDLLIDANLGVRIFPGVRKSLYAASARTRAASASRRLSSLFARLLPGHPELRQHTCPAVPYHAAAVEDLLELVCEDRAS